MHKDEYTEKGAAKYHCLNCGKYFNDLTKTIFEHHKFSIEEIVLHLEGDGGIKIFKDAIKWVTWEMV